MIGVAGQKSKEEWGRVACYHPTFFLVLASSHGQPGRLERIKIAGRNINNIGYADNTVLLSDSKEKLQRLVDELSEECRSYGLSVNTTKSKVLGLTKRKEQLEVNVTLEGRA